MADFQLNILGCGSATPSLRHIPTCQVVDFRNKLMMIDCGEGAQLAMRRMRLKFSRLTNIFISHLHGDHCLGLPGLLSTLALQEVGGTVTIHTFADGAEILGKVFDFFCREHSFNLEFNIIKPERAIIYEDKAMTVETFPLYHRVPCTGFIFREKPKLRHIIRDMVDAYNVPIAQMQALKEGADFITDDGRVIENSRLTTAASPSISYAYCSDTLYDPRVAEAVKGVDVIYHEATYIEADAEKAHQRGHATATEAARVAVEAGAKMLVLGHYSKSYLNEDTHLAEARAYADAHGRSDMQIFLANEGLSLDLTTCR
ncbi:MAG: ribonuclease Z [Muribaculaceae bacterium]|nr:ribonuclease Z [Muribaculaceae bacterium]